MNDEVRSSFIVPTSSFHMSVSAIILAAGRSTRMKSNHPKVLHEVCGKPMLEHVLNACYSAGATKVMVVVGFGKEEVISRFADDKRIEWVEQTQQLGTGHAARMCEELVKKIGGDVFILAGDGPMIRGEVLQTLLRAHKDDHAAASMATAVMDDPFGYGRIIRDVDGNFLDIVEEVDCTPEQREIREVFPSYYCFKADDLCLALSKLTNNNRKGEYYLTDTFGILRREGRKIAAVQAVTAEDVLAANDRKQLADVDAAMQSRIQRNLMDSGVTIVSPINTYIESGVQVGRDTIIHPFTFIGRDTTVGGECVIGPFATLPRESIVREGMTIAGNIAVESATLDRRAN
jgi:bifunctional UDP-N-acetylglucosamine pyrophosphorylase/glucosamine-1-phosphate N-acetyltransferase